MKKPIYEYIRVGINYYKLVYRPLLSGDSVLVYLKWNYNTLVHDRVRIEDIKYFHDFIVYPSHTHYMQEINGFFNKYSPMEHLPAKGNCPTILLFIQHIFGEQIELGLDYLKIIYEQPTQTLPILCLVSEERSTGKTTFLNFLKLIYGANMTLNTNEDFRSQFNSGWSHCVLIGIDEAFLDKKEDSERIKNLSTARTYKEESKGVDKREIEFFGKFILCSNNTRDFIKIDKQETRYWIRDLPVLQSYNIDLLEQMKKEIPHFLQQLLDRKYSTPRLTRMWFTPNQLHTKALDRVKHYNSSVLEMELIHILSDIFELYPVDEIQFSRQDVSEWLKHFNIKNNSLKSIRQLLQEFWSLKPTENTTTYKQYSFDENGEPTVNQGKARFYTIHRKFIYKF